MEFPGENREASAEEDHLLERSKRKSKETDSMGKPRRQDQGKVRRLTIEGKGPIKIRSWVIKEEVGPFDATDLDDGEVSDDDLIKKSTDGSWFGMGMIKEEKIEETMAQ